jgi:hypothetical protein
MTPTAMTRDELLAKLRALAGDDDEHTDTEQVHVDADRALLEYIADQEITDAFDEVGKWYA